MVAVLIQVKQTQHTRCNGATSLLQSNHTVLHRHKGTQQRDSYRRKMMCAAAAICEENYTVDAGGMHNRKGKDADGLGERGGQGRKTVRLGCTQTG